MVGPDTGYHIRSSHFAVLYVLYTLLKVSLCKYMVDGNRGADRTASSCGWGEGGTGCGWVNAVY